MTRQVITKVNGVTFEGRQENLKQVHEGDDAKIVPEPTNEYDSNALAVYIATGGGVLHCGYIPRDLSIIIAPLLEGEAVMAKVLEVTGGFDTFDGGHASLGLRLAIELPI